MTTNTPAIRLFPATPGPHPIALLVHGNGGSKEMLFRYGEALAAAGHFSPFFILMPVWGIGALLLLPSTLVGRIAGGGGSRRDRDIGMAVIASYALGQFIPLFY